MVGMSGIAPRSSDQQPATFIHVNDTTPSEVMREARQSPRYVETRANFIIIKPTRRTNFTNLFWHETPHVSDSSSVHLQEFIHFAICNPGPARNLSTNLYGIYHCKVYIE